MTKDRFLELNEVWEQSPLYYIITAHGYVDEQDKAIVRLTKQYAPDTLLGSKEGAYFALEQAMQSCNDAMTLALKSKTEYNEYIQMLTDERPADYEVIYQLGLFGVSVYEKL